MRPISHIRESCLECPPPLARGTLKRAMTSESDSQPRGRPDRSQRRRQVRARRLDGTVPSPCIAVCQLDDETGRCIGCHRSTDEIRGWIIMTADEKREVLAKIETRRGGSGN